MSNKKDKPKNKEVKSAPLKAKQDNVFKEEVLRWILTILCSIGFFACIAYVINENYQPDVKEILEYITKLSFTGNPRPEPTESLLVKLGMVLLPVFLLLFYFLFSKRTKFIKTIVSGNGFNFITTFIVLLVVVMIYYDFSAPNPFSPSTGAQAEHLRDVECKTNFEFFFKGLFLGKHLLLYTFIITPLLFTVFYVGLKKYNLEQNRIYNFFF